MTDYTQKFVNGTSRKRLRKNNNEHMLVRFFCNNASFVWIIENFLELVTCLFDVQFLTESLPAFDHMSSLMLPR